jgi:FAD:protein FMN transferase
MRKLKQTKTWLLLSICFLILICSIIGYIQSKPSSNNEELTITLTNVGFDTPVTLSATCSQSQFSKYTKILKKTFKENNKRFDQYNAYKGINNVYTLNHEAYNNPIEVDDILLDCIKVALNMQSKNSQFNITQGNLLNLWHNSRENTQIPPTNEEIQNALQHNDINSIKIDGNNITFLDSDLSIDLGGIAKGYTAQLAKEKLNKAGLTSGYINAGGNVVLLGKKNDATKWKIGIQSPDESSALIQYETKNATCLVTSGDYQRYFTYKKKKYSHIIDPQTGYPATYCRSVTVITQDSGIADALSTTLFCMSVEDGKKYLQSLDYQVDAIWILDSSSDINADLENKDYKIVTTDHIKNKVTLVD